MRNRPEELNIQPYAQQSHQNRSVMNSNPLTY